MELTRDGEQVEHELCSRLKIGNKWYGRGSKVMLDKADAEVYRMRGFSKPTVPQEKTEGKPKLSAAEVGVITKEAEAPLLPRTAEKAIEQQEAISNGKSRNKGR